MSMYNKRCLRMRTKDNDDEIGYDKKGDNYDREMLIVMTRYILSVSIAIISSTTAIILSIIINYGYYISIIVGFDAFLNGLCLYLFNKFSYRVYNTICHHPHKLYESLCIKCIFCCN